MVGNRALIVMWGLSCSAQRRGSLISAMWIMVGSEVVPQGLLTFLKEANIPKVTTTGLVFLVSLANDKEMSRFLA